MSALRASVKLHPAIAESNSVYEIVKQSANFALLKLSFIDPLEKGEAGVFRLRISPKPSEFNTDGGPSIVNESHQREPKEYSWCLSHFNDQATRESLEFRLGQAVERVSGKSQESIESIRAIVNSEMRANANTACTRGEELLAVIAPRDMDVESLSNLVRTASDRFNDETGQVLQRDVYTIPGSPSNKDSLLMESCCKYLYERFLESPKALSIQPVLDEFSNFGIEFWKGLIHELAQVGVLDEVVPKLAYKLKNEIPAEKFLAECHKVWLDIQYGRQTKFGADMESQWEASFEASFEVSWQAFSKDYKDPSDKLSERVDGVENRITRLSTYLKRSGIVNRVIAIVSLIIGIISLWGESLAKFFKMFFDN